MSILILSVIPFILMLLSIAVLPLFFHHFWEKNTNKLIITLLLCIPAIAFLFASGHQENLFETIVFDYVPFMILLGSLYTITGGVFLSGDIEAKPLVNTAFLALGAVLASIMGTTGAAMLLIRPVIQTNKERTFKVHTVLFFIAIVANCGGLLTPLGDPPLFMMYLRGTPFTWFLNLAPEWLFTNALLLIVYFFIESHFHKKEPVAALIRDKMEQEPIKIKGAINLVFLLGVILAVAFINEQYLPLIKTNHYFKFLREVVILLMSILSLLFYAP